MTRYYHIGWLVLLCFIALIGLPGCANRGIGPQGGPKDSIPPMPVKTIPENGSVNFHGDKLSILFNEYIQLDNVSANLLMSPPQQTPPEVKARGKHVLVQFKDSLIDSTTYTLDFGDAICDYTEKNPHHNYLFSFATGPEIDTLETIGTVYWAENLNPASGISVGIHDNLSDSAFETMPFLRLARTDSLGRYKISNMRPGTYRLYALDDISRDYRLTAGEALAFADELLTTEDSAESELFLFKQQQQRLYLQRATRDQQHRIALMFSAPSDSLPTWRVLKPSEVDSTSSDSAWIDPTPYLLPIYSTHWDTITIWLTDSAAISQDKIFLEAQYRRTDSLYRLEWFTDTIRAIWRAPRLSAKAKEALERRNRNRRLELKTNARTSFDIYDTLRVTSSTPLDSVCIDSIHLVECVDTVCKPIPFTLRQTPQELIIAAEWKPGKKYELRLDSAALHDIYHVTHVAANYPLQVKTLEEYSTLRVKIQPNDLTARVQLLSKEDKVLHEQPVTDNGAYFPYLKPDTYYMRLYLDSNGDGKWTTGEWSNKTQPEKIYYFSDKIQTKSNWDFEEEWNYLEAPQTQAKPQELIKAAKKK